MWADLLGYMHEAEPYGYLLIDGKTPNVNNIAALIGRPLPEVRKAMAELGEHGVYSLSDSPSLSDNQIIYSRRMVRDAAKEARDRENGKGGGNPALTGKDKGQVNPPDKAQKPEARDQKPEKERTDSRAVAVATRPEIEIDFDKFWLAYPERDGANPKAPAQKKFTAAVRAGEPPSAIIAGATAYARAETERVGTPYIAQAVTWLNQRRWEDYAPVAVAASTTGPPPPPFPGAPTLAELKERYAEPRIENVTRDAPESEGVPGEGEGISRGTGTGIGVDQEEQRGASGVGKILPSAVGLDAMGHEAHGGRVARNDHDAGRVSGIIRSAIRRA